MEFIFTFSMSVSSSCSSSISMLWTALPLELLHTSLKWFILLHFHTSAHMLGTILVCGPGHSICIFLSQAFSQVWLILPLSNFSIVSRFFNSCKLLMTASWVLCTSYLFAHVNKCTLGIITLSSLLVSSLMIFVSISLLFSPCMN